MVASIAPPVRLAKNCFSWQRMFLISSKSTPYSVYSRTRTRPSPRSISGAFQAWSVLGRCFGPIVPGCQQVALRLRRLGSSLGWLARVGGWVRRFDSPAPHGGLTLRAPASPASKTPPIPRRFSTSKGGSGGGGRLMRASHRPRRRRKNWISSGRTMVWMRRRVPWQHGHFSGSVPQTRRMRSRHKGRMARAVALGGEGERGISD